jgi:hypothetical protein
MLSQGSYVAVPVTARRAKRDNGGLGEDPPGNTMSLLTGRSDLDAQWGSEGDLPVTARRAKRENGGSGGGSPRKHDELLTGGSDLDVQSRQ